MVEAYSESSITDTFGIYTQGMGRTLGVSHVQY